MCTADLVDQEKVFSKTNADHRGHVADIEVNTNAEWFHADIRDRADDMFCAIKSVINLTSCEIAKLAF